MQIRYFFEQIENEKYLEFGKSKQYVRNLRLTEKRQTRARAQLLHRRNSLIQRQSFPPAKSSASDQLHVQSDNAKQRNVF